MKTANEAYQDGDIGWSEYRHRLDMEEILGYNPNRDPLVFGTYVPGRSGQKFKVHKSLGNARAATTKYLGGVYQLDGDQWVLVEIRRQGQVIRDFTVQVQVEILESE